MTASTHSEPAGRHAQTDPLYPLIEDTRQLVTILDLIRWASSRMDEQQVFLGHGTQHYWDEAAWLVLDSLHLPLDLDAAHWSAKLTPAWFMGQPYYVDERVLIPRSPFAELIAQHFEPWYDADTPPSSILDIGTGSGCLAIALAQHFPEAVIGACDISMDALSVAARNVRDYQLEDRIELYQSDLLDNLKDETGAPLRFDLIISNPPYVDPAEAEDMPQEYHHEPAMALYAPNQGMALIERMLDTASEHLSPDGYLFVEVGNGRRLIDQTWPRHRLSWIEMHNQEAVLFTIACSELADWRG
ncbi:MAG: ribosomal protein L3 N(5)-glutamine methyltransferase [Halothiobacillus sp. 14-56-357]|nr:MAG: ribosomal protein L3 N(5)-glutamine methyltransferase [Halothiobacillus sp. 14-56-357]